ncbi:M14 family zinc carboxypeptidase [Lutibacter holmesii]|uniref:M14 family zinc carboxypeptidase n=1 Tax=Lutibacter holmesii TaxID=1137985 RepID=A0ABW3WPV4_9FLAO
MNSLNPNILESWYASNFQNELKGRQILFEDIAPLIQNLSSIFEKEIIGHSENNIPIYKISIGNGSKRILCWSQMHGNESTGTKALFDLFNFFDSEDLAIKNIASTILKECRMEFIVLLNPDGAIKFTRENFNNIDLNRDAVDISAIESKLLRNCLDTFNPEFCFNLHDQRSIFNVDGQPNPATISFLAPSEDLERTLTNGRKETMSVIVAMNSLLQQMIPNHIGRYTDEFYPTATGDNFQKLGHNTILIEAGHFKDDYNREKTREYNFYALVQGLYFIASTSNYSNYEPYFDIPNNNKLYLDIIYKNIKDSDDNVIDVGVQLKYSVINSVLSSYKCIECTGDLSNYYANTIVNGENLNINDLKLSNS